MIRRSGLQIEGLEGRGLGRSRRDRKAERESGLREDEEMPGLGRLRRGSRSLRLFAFFGSDVDQALVMRMRPGRLDWRVEATTRGIVGAHDVDGGLGGGRRVGVDDGGDVLGDKGMPVEAEEGAELPEGGGLGVGVLGVVDVAVVGAGDGVVGVEELLESGVLVEELVDGGEEAEGVGGGGGGGECLPAGASRRT